MKFVNIYSKFIPYLYFIAISIFWFTEVNKVSGVTAYPILLLGIPFLWQIIKPNRKLNFALGITFVCLSSYIILAYLSNLLNIVDIPLSIKEFIIFGGLFVAVNFVMALWIIRNSIKRAF